MISQDHQKADALLHQSLPKGSADQIASTISTKEGKGKTSLLGVGWGEQQVTEYWDVLILARYSEFCPRNKNG